MEVREGRQEQGGSRKVSGLDLGECLCPVGLGRRKRVQEMNHLGWKRS